jgi:hypothetical protein
MSSGAMSAGTAWGTTVEQQVLELRSALLVEADNFAIEHGQLCIRYIGIDVLGQVGE